MEKDGILKIVNSKHHLNQLFMNYLHNLSPTVDEAYPYGFA
jgi:hypothetical protein